MDVERKPPIPVWLVLVGTALIVGLMLLAVVLTAGALPVAQPGPEPVFSARHAGPLHASRSHVRPTPTVGPAWHTTKPPKAPSQPPRTHVDWDAIALCESGGHWNHPSTARYTGGLQMDLTFWHSYHGDRYAAWPWQATKAQQITVAERAYKVRGLTPWPTCGRLG